MEQILQLFKIDLGVSHNLRDPYFESLLLSSKDELSRKGIVLDLSIVEDQMLLSDYAAWKYRNRQNDVPLSKNLNLRIKNRQMRRRSEC